MSASEESASVLNLPGGSGSASARVAEASSRAERRLRRQRDTLRPLGLVVLAAVVVSAINGHPAPGLHARPLAVTLAVAVFAVTLALVITGRVDDRGPGVQSVVIAGMGAAGVALTALQPRGATELAAGTAVWMAVVRLPPALGIALAVAVTAALAVALALAGGSAAAVVAATLLCALLGLVGYFVKQARTSQDLTELLLAELEDAREEQLRAAAVTERGRIASELHDVLAHSLSGAAIQLQGARKLAEREQTSPQIRSAIDRAGELVKDGLSDARQAVGALRGEELPNVSQLEALVTSYSRDTGLDATLRIDGSPRTLPADASLALYRGAQEALTNVVRYAPGAHTSVVLRYAADRTTLTVENSSPSTAGGLTDVGGGRGLTGLQERLERAGGSMRAGPTGTGWRVELDVPG